MPTVRRALSSHVSEVRSFFSAIGSLLGISVEDAEIEHDKFGKTFSHFRPDLARNTFGSALETPSRSEKIER